MALGTSEGNERMLGYHAINCTKTSKNKGGCDDIENNNNVIEISNSDDQDFLPQYSSNAKGIFAQCLVSGAILLLAAGCGMPTGYSAVLLPQLVEDNATIHVDEELRSWIASVHSLATPVGSLLSGPFLEMIGRRGSMQLSTVPLCVGWIVMGYAWNVSCIIVGRIFCGFAVGLMAVPSQVIMGEMADPGLRGFLVAGAFAAYCFGILIIYTFGASFKWNTVAFCATVLPVLALVSLVFIPESPAWLVRRRKIKAARKALLWLRGGDEDQVNTELAILETRIKADRVEKSLDTSLSDRVSSAISTILNPGVWKPLVIINVFNLLQLASGTYVIVFYAVDLVKDIGGDSVNNYLAAVVTAAIRFAFCVLSCVLLLKMGRRPLGIVSAVGTALSSLVLAGYMLVKKDESPADSYVFGVCLLTYVGANTVGLLTLPGLMTGELLPLRARGVGGGFNYFLTNLLVFVVTKCFPMVSKAVGITAVFMIFATGALLEAIFIYIALPETKDRTLQEIEDYFKQDNILWVTRTKRQNRVIH